MHRQQLLSRAGRWCPAWAVWQAMWWTQSHFVVAVVGVVWASPDHVLLLRHSYRPRYPWGLPTGWVRAGETPETALLREIREESGLHLPGPLHPLGSALPRPRHLELGFWIDSGLEAGEAGAAGLAGTPSADGEVLAAGWYRTGHWPGPLMAGQEAWIARARRARQEAGRLA
ncbi:MAG: NUDIX domain-containing protein [Firmicutes bacterium]|nr:NUDIX domain-containing protein [Bacillota bacterium]